METGTLFNMIHKISETDFGIMFRQARIMKEGLSTSFRVYASNAEPLDDDTFWEMLEELREQLDSTIHKKLKSKGKLKGIKYANVERGISLFVWPYAHGEKSDRLDDVVRFVRTYDVKVGALYKPLFNEIEGFGDDGYGDVLDSFPLFGRKVYELALKSQLCGESEKQYQGENYIAMRLTDSVFEHFASVAANEAGRILTEELGEDSYYVEQRKIYKKLGLKTDID